MSVGSAPMQAGAIRVSTSDFTPGPMRECLAPAGEAGIGLNLHQQGVERGARLAGELELGRARLQLLTVGDGRDAGDFHAIDGGTPRRSASPGYFAIAASDYHEA